MEIYLILEDAGAEGYYFRGVFSNFELAEKELNELKSSSHFPEDFCIEIKKLDIN